MYGAGGSLGTVGEEYTEFEKADGKGPFECGNCTHQTGGICEHPQMIKHSSQPHADGGVKVGEHDCCKYVRRK